MHTESHPLAGQTVTLNEKASDPHRGMVVAGEQYHIEDYWDKITGKSWMNSDGNPAAMMFAMRTGLKGLDAMVTDDEVVYGKIGGMGHLVHVSELGEVSA